MIEAAEGFFSGFYLFRMNPMSDGIVALLFQCLAGFDMVKRYQRSVLSSQSVRVL